MATETKTLKEFRMLLSDEIDRLNAEMFELVRKLASTSYESQNDQLDDATKVGELAQDIKHLRDTRTRVDRRDMERAATAKKTVKEGKANG